MLRVAINSSINFTAIEVAKLKRAASILETVVNSEEFKKRVLAYKFTNTDGLSNQQIYDLIMSGSEVLNPEVDHEIDIDITMYWKWNSVIGFTYPNTVRTWINRRFYKNMSSVEIAGNLIHEWTHKIGFSHDFYNTKSRPYSVPYAIGYMVAELGEESLTQIKEAV